MRNIIAALLIMTFCLGAEARTGAEIETKINELILKMTVEEKLGQLQQLDGGYDVPTSTTIFALARKGLLGSTLNTRGAAKVNELQKAALESRLKIPIFFAFDVIHGYRTIFPVPLAETASWDPALAEEAASVAAAESRAAGVRWTFAPMVDIARDPRWGRIVEGSGEDTYLGSAMAVARVKGFQGDDYSAPGKIAACAKHWGAYGAAEGGRDYNSTDVSERTLREIYFPPFKAAVDAGVATFMSSFNDLNGVPASGNRWLMTDVLRKEFGFKGFVVSDYGAIGELINHGFAANNAEAAEKGIEAGVDMEMVSTLYNEKGLMLLKDKKLSIKQIDDAVRNILRIKFRAGIFDTPMADETEEAAVIFSPAHQAAARKAAAKSFVLLKNDGTLPLSKNITSIAVIGSMADDKVAPIGSWFGDYSSTDTITILQGLREKAGSSIKVSYSRIGGPEDKSQNFSEALNIAKEADVVIAVVGESPTMSGEASARSTLAIPGNQLDLLKALKDTGKPVVAVLLNGRPVEIDWLDKNLSAVLDIWYPGSMAGYAVADTLFGDENPGGKLPLSWPRVTGQIPFYYNHRNTGRPPVDPDNKYSSKYLDLPTTPQYPFGYGLSYSSFSLSGFEISAGTITVSGTVTVKATLENTSYKTGDEVVQLYIRDHSASVTRPVKELRGFKRLTLRPQEKVVVEFTLGPKELGFLDSNYKFVVEPGQFTVWIGTSSEGGLNGSLFVKK